jgi:cytoskeletal protein RodZ
MDKKIVNYVRENLHKGYSMADVAGRLRKEGWEDEDIQDALAQAAKGHQHKTRLLIVSLGFAALLILGIMAYLVIMSPAFVKEPVLAKPKLIGPVREAEFSGDMLAQTAELENQQLQAAQEAIPEPEPEPKEAPAETPQEPVPSAAPSTAAVIDENHIAYLLTQMGMYKLHPNPFTGALPEIEIVISDTGKTYAAVVQDNEVVVNPGNAAKPDARITVAQDAVTELLAAENSEQLQQTAATLFSQREQKGYKGELITGQTDLLLKGYLALYKEAKAVIPTGSVVSEVELAGSQVVGMFVMIVVLWGALILRMWVKGGE